MGRLAGYPGKEHEAMVALLFPEDPALLPEPLGSTGTFRELSIKSLAMKERGASGKKKKNKKPKPSRVMALPLVAGFFWFFFPYYGSNQGF